MDAANKIVKGAKNTSDGTLWFAAVIAEVKSIALMMEKNVAPKDTKDAMDAFRFGNVIDSSKCLIDGATKSVVPELIADYLGELINRDVQYTELAFDFSNNNLLAWVEVDFEDEMSEAALILAEAKINAMYEKSYFRISSSIVYKGDGLSVPSQYSKIT